MKKLLTITLLTVFLIGISGPAAWAGAKQRYRWEGVAIGVGASILGHALIHEPHHYNRPYRGGGAVILRGDRDRCNYSERRHQRRPFAKPDRRHFKTRRIWVSPVYEKVWNPGHYDVDQRWVPGRWIQVIREPGHWVEKRKWSGRP